MAQVLHRRATTLDPTQVGSVRFLRFAAEFARLNRKFSVRSLRKRFNTQIWLVRSMFANRTVLAGRETGRHCLRHTRSIASGADGMALRSKMQEVGWLCACWTCLTNLSANDGEMGPASNHSPGSRLTFLGHMVQNQI